MKDVKRRTFLKESLLAAGAALPFGFEERALLARAEDARASSTSAGGSNRTRGTAVVSQAQAAPGALPKGQIGDMTVSRLICGGNLISGFAHSRDLIYVSKLLKNYFTDDKIFETFRLAEESGIDTAILRLDANTIRIINKYWREQGGGLQWIAQIKPKPEDLTTDVQKAIDNGAAGVYVQGETGDAFYKNGQVAMLGKIIETIKGHGVIAGMGAHDLNVVVACEKDGIPSDFYMKTFNSKSYWSAGPMPRYDSVWEETPKETAEFMKTVEKPWIAFKVLGAGAISPEEGFQYAFENGADFICVGMFDFQVKEDAALAARILSGELKRERPWRS